MVAGIAAGAAVKANGGTGIPHARVLAALDAMDAAVLDNTVEEAKTILAPHAGVLARADAAARNGQAR